MKNENEWQDHYSVLDVLDRKDPFFPLMQFSFKQPLFDTRKTLSLLFQLAMSNKDWSRDWPDERAKMAELSIPLLRLIEASYLIIELWQDDKLTYHFGPVKKDKNRPPSKLNQHAR
jgi:hypothetical protein